MNTPGQEIKNEARAMYDDNLQKPLVLPTSGSQVKGEVGIDGVSEENIRKNSIVANQIKAGAITTDKLDANAVTAAKIAAGTITATELATDSVEADKIKANAVTATKIATDAVEADKIKAGAVTAGKISVSNLAAINAALGNVTAGVLTVDGGGSSYITIAKGTGAGSNGNLRFTGGSRVWEDSSNHLGLQATGDVYFYRNGSSLVMLLSSGAANIYPDLYVGSGSGGEDIRPIADGAGSVGVAAARWADVYAVDGSINTSDERDKTEIEETDLGLEFINKLSPKKYKWKEVFNREHKKDKTVPPRRKGKRYHYGLVAQDVEKVLGDTDGFAGIIIDEQGKYGLRYGEFIAPMISAIQELSKKVEVLEAKTEAQEKEIRELKTK